LERRGIRLLIHDKRGQYSISCDREGNGKTEEDERAWERGMLENCPTAKKKKKEAGHPAFWFCKKGNH